MQEKEDTWQPTTTILIVERNASLELFLATTLGCYGYVTLCQPTHLDAKLSVEFGLIDLLLVGLPPPASKQQKERFGYRPPFMYPLIREVQAWQEERHLPPLPIIATSSMPREEMAASLLEWGCHVDGLIPQPFHIKDLANLITSLLPTAPLPRKDVEERREAA